jgi:F-type H+-transporting ATPase subunit gamma
MPSLKEVRNRIQSVVSTQQITKAMKMVAAAKLRRAQDRIIMLRPFEQRLSSILSNLTSSISGDFELPLAQANGVKDVLVIAITSDRGLCGAFNSNVIKGAQQLILERYPEASRSGDVHVMCIGKKGCEFFMRRGYNVIDQYSDVFGRLNFENASEAAEAAIQGYLRGEFGEVVLVYNEFKNVATQIVRFEQLLPVPPVEKTAEDASASVDYLLEPSAEEIIVDLLPRMLKTKVFKALLESNASENGARMTAMDKATENAGELLKDLRLTYNRSRQASITKEILEIVGGAEALSSN